MYKALYNYYLQFLVVCFKIIHKLTGLRIGEIETRAVGHSSIPIETYLSELDAGVIQRGRNDYWFLNEQIANQVLINKWKPFFRLVPRRWVSDFFHHCQDTSTNLHLTIQEYRHWKQTNLWQGFDVHRIMNKTKPHLSFTEEESNYCKEKMLKMGIKTQFVCAMVRDRAYRGDPPSHRDSELENYKKAFKELASLGFQTVRMGAKVESTLTDELDGMVIDYATNGYREELLDLFLIYKCRFLLTTGLGLDGVGRSLRKPLLMINYTELALWHHFGKEDIPVSLVKLCWSSRKRRYLNLKELFEIGVYGFTSASDYHERGLIWVENSPSEIAAAAREMTAFLDSKLKLSSEDELRQEAFKSLYKKAFGGDFPSLISPFFLENNKEILFPENDIIDNV